MDKTFYVMSGDKVLLEFIIDKTSLKINKTYKENKNLLPFILKNDISSRSLGYWLNSRISPLGKKLLKQIVKDDRSKGPLGHLGLTLGLSLNDIFWVHDGSHTWQEPESVEKKMDSR